MRVATYLRVSTGRQTLENQQRDLRAYCEARGWSDVVEYSDQGISGTKDRRPSLDALMVAVRARKVDIVVVAAFDRFARSVRHLVTALDEMNHLGVAFVSLRESIDTASPTGRMVFTVVGAVAELERSLIVERIHSALRRAKAQGKRLGRPTVEVGVAQVRRAVERAGSLRKAARTLGCSVGTIRNRLAAGGPEQQKRVSRMEESASRRTSAFSTGLTRRQPWNVRMSGGGVHRGSHAENRD